MQDRVKYPANALIVLGVAGIVITVLSLPFGAWLFELARRQGGRHNVEDFERVKQFGTTFNYAFALLSIVASIFILLAGNQMKQMKHRTLALIASALAVLSGLPTCCCMVGMFSAVSCIPVGLAGIPIGIWSIVVLMKPEVKQAFTS